MEAFTFTNLEPLIGEFISAFDPEKGEQLDQLKITEVKRAIQHGDQYDAFVVELKGSEDIHLPQDNYLFKHPSFGERQLFLSPFSVNEYEIIVSRAVEK